MKGGNVENGPEVFEKELQIYYFFYLLYGSASCRKLEKGQG